MDVIIVLQNYSLILELFWNIFEHFGTQFGTDIMKALKDIIRAADINSQSNKIQSVITDFSIKAI